MSLNDTKSSQNDEITNPMPAEDRREFLLNNELYSDVTFRVGPHRQPIYGHKIILMCSSKYFFNLFKNANVNTITLKTVERNDFLEILRYVYCEKINLTAENVRAIYRQSKIMSFEMVVKAVVAFLIQNINPDNVLEKMVENCFYQACELLTFILAGT
ncbi:kelch-like protein 40a [Topomyia yanbarensis]|uniref:kelch-like protein 40a n=1 Tax=Topomyia yanbarensis TaxID=2498891 RepID=UPI00273C6E35|nr:kelch-like protein 40a [Topomyia yanbarensis]